MVKLFLNKYKIDIYIYIYIYIHINKINNNKKVNERQRSIISNS